MFNAKQILAAKVAHQVNNGLRSYFNEPYNADWDELDDESKQRALVGVSLVSDNPDITPKECHKAWIESMANQGYRYGPEIDPVRMEHPAMVPYASLPEPQKLKTMLFISIVKSICVAN
ncbi:MAG: RyR domain-containing protein [Clostridium sp.]|uniref:RyR domain-containing protein n=1 Tax=Clostridium sp. TaxID=1506 RepID=UPI003EE63824